jgi:hypothetical protein
MVHDNLEFSLPESVPVVWDGICRLFLVSEARPSGIETMVTASPDQVII